MHKLHNSVLPRKVYGIYHGYKELGEVIADNVHDAYRDGRAKWGIRARAAILKGTTSREPMFVTNG